MTAPHSPPADQMPALRIQNVNMSFKTAKGPIQALSNVSLDVAQNTFVSIVGRSGCGKSTLLRIVTELLARDSGNVEVMGKSPAAYQAQKKFGFVFQEASLLAWKTVAQNIAMPLEILGGMTKAERDARVAEVLDLVRLKDFAGHYPAQLSGGMRQRVAIARALAYEPEILLMDEPFGALDEFTRREMHDELIRIWQARNLTVVFVTHSLTEAMYLSDQIVVMAPRPGRVREIVDVARPRVGDREAMADPVYLAQLAHVEDLLNEQ